LVTTLDVILRKTIFEWYRQSWEVACFHTSLTLQNVDVEEAWLNLGLLQRSQGKYEASLQSFKECLEIDPKCQLAIDSIESLRDVQEALTLAGRISPSK
jgi:tetratricopeptide (TPR) repeat protein